MAIGAVGLLAVVYFFPVGGSIWTVRQVTGVAQVSGEIRVELQDRGLLELAARDALTEARTTRFRRWIPWQNCHPFSLEFQTSGRWVSVRVPCSSGLQFDYIPREAWR